MHDFPGGNKSAGFQVQEMGESGEGSLEPGVASARRILGGVSRPNPASYLRTTAASRSKQSPRSERDGALVGRDQGGVRGVYWVDWVDWVDRVAYHGLLEYR